MRSLPHALAVVLVSSAVAPAVRAESAADKATAREVATEGIQLYRAGKYADALDRFRRAQALYDAPVHLLYIARSQAKLGQLVEASENYRLLDHYALPSGAPPAWVSAVDDGRKELQALEPRIPKLRILTDPGVRDPSLRVDGNPVSAAVLGLPRPVNPGQHHVELAVNGFEPGVADVAIAESESKDVTVRPGRPVAGAPIPPPAAPPNGPPPPGAAPTGAEEKPSLIGFLAGARLGGAVPTGQALHFTGARGIVSQDINMSDVFQSGGGAELHLGVRIAQYFTPVLYAETEGLTPGSGFDRASKISGTTARSAGLGLIVGTAPHKLGGFGELDFLTESYSYTSTPNTSTQECKVKASGGALRLGGGGFLPIVSFLNATAFAMITVGRFASLETSGNTCVVSGGDIPSDDQRTHSSVFIGIGGDFVFGADRVQE